MVVRVLLFKWRLVAALLSFLGCVLLFFGSVPFVRWVTGDAPHILIGFAAVFSLVAGMVILTVGAFAWKAISWAQQAARNLGDAMAADVGGLGIRQLLSAAGRQRPPAPPESQP